MIPDPLHPAVVHFPVALATLLPLFAFGALWLHRGMEGRPRSWALVVALSGLLVVSGFVALRTGEAQEEIVEEVVPESAIHDHEEAAEIFFWLSAGTFVLMLVGMTGGTAGRWGRGLAMIATLLVFAAGARTGLLGGELVYEHGAAEAYVNPGAGR